MGFHCRRPFWEIIVHDESVKTGGSEVCPRQFFLASTTLALVAFPAAAQQQKPLAPSASPTSQSQTGVDTGGDKSLEGQGQNTLNKDRLFGVLPNYTTVENEHQFGRLSTKDKFKLTADSMFDPATFPFIGFVALIGQAENSNRPTGRA